MKRNGNNRKSIRGTTPVKPIGGRLKKINLLFIIDQPFMSGVSLLSVKVHVAIPNPYIELYKD